MSDDGSEYVSNHDRGAFGKLLAEAKALYVKRLDFRIDFMDRPASPGDDPDFRWRCVAQMVSGARAPEMVCEYGRTGEEALRRLVEKLRG